jgi:DNA invertase Pin-like site-specific DNA recombinase
VVRPGLQEALRRVLELGKDGVLCVARLDRVGRNAIEVQVVLRDLLDAGVRVVAIGDSIDTSSGMGRSILRLLMKSL